MAGDRHQQYKAMDWRPIGEFHNAPDAGKMALQMCTEAALQLGLKYENYRCVRNK
jgi:hypothetical protein